MGTKKYIIQKKQAKKRQYLLDQLIYIIVNNKKIEKELDLENGSQKQDHILIKKWHSLQIYYLEIFIDFENFPKIKKKQNIKLNLLSFKILYF